MQRTSRPGRNRRRKESLPLDGQRDRDARVVAPDNEWFRPTMVVQAEVKKVSLQLLLQYSNIN